MQQQQKKRMLLKVKQNILNVYFLSNLHAKRFEHLATIMFIFRGKKVVSKL